MKLTPVSGSYTPDVIQTALDYFAVPSTSTLVAALNDTTSQTEGAKITTTYRVHTSSTQVAGTYTGQVRYTLTHSGSGQSIYNLTASSDGAIAPNEILTVTSDTSLRDFVNVTVNGATVPSTYYRISDDYTSIIFTEEFSSTYLSLGTYTIGITSLTGEGSINITVENSTLSAKAILGANGNLNFINDSQSYSVGDTYTDNLGETTISAIYNVPTDSTTNTDVAWTGTSSDDARPEITAVNFDNSFYSFHPTSTAYWFYRDMYIDSMTNMDNLNTSSVINMSRMLLGVGGFSSSISLDVSSWDTSNVANMSYMFSRTTGAVVNLIGLNTWDVSNVTNMSYMFCAVGQYSTSITLDLSGWDTSSVTDMSWMFYNITWDSRADFELDLSSFNTSKVTNMSYMFQDAIGLTTIYVGDGWDTSKVTSSSTMFGYNNKLVGGNGTTFNSSYTDKTYARIDTAETPGYLTYKGTTSSSNNATAGTPLATASNPTSDSTSASSSGAEAQQSSASNDNASDSTAQSTTVTNNSDTSSNDNASGAPNSYTNPQGKTATTATAKGQNIVPYLLVGILLSVATAGACFVLTAHKKRKGKRNNGRK